jgi:hypothetical protein
MRWQAGHSTGASSPPSAGRSKRREQSGCGQYTRRAGSMAASTISTSSSCQGGGGTASNGGGWRAARHGDSSARGAGRRSGRRHACARGVLAASALAGRRAHAPAAVAVRHTSRSLGLPLTRRAMAACANSWGQPGAGQDTGYLRACGGRGQGGAMQGLGGGRTGWRAKRPCPRTMRRAGCMQCGCRFSRLLLHGAQPTPSPRGAGLSRPAPTCSSPRAYSAAQPQHIA